MKSPLSGREWSKLLKNLDLFGGGMDAIAQEDLHDPIVDDELNSLMKIPVGAGWLSIVDEHLMIQNGENPLLNPLISAQSPVILKVNGKEIYEPVHVGSSDRIEFEIRPQPLFTITVSEDRLHVFLSVHRSNTYKQTIKNTNPAYELILTVQEHTDELLEELTYEKIIAEIQRLKITCSIRPDAIFEQLLAPGGEASLVGSGTPSIPPQHAWIEKFFIDDVHNFVPEEDERGRVDFRSHLHIPTVKAGDVIARMHPPIPGESGMDVYGAPIIPAPAKALVLKARQNVIITPQMEVKATKSGRPTMSGTDLVEFEVIPCFEWQGDVDFRSGNLMFDGDIVVNGNVMEGMVVESRGRVTIHGNVYRSTVTAGHGVTVNGNVISGNVYAGQESPSFQHFRQLTIELHEIWSLWAATARFAMARLRKAGQPVRRGTLLMSLIQTKFQDVPNRVRKLLHQEHQLRPAPDSPIKALANQLQQLMAPNFWSEDGGLELLDVIESSLSQLSLPPNIGGKTVCVFVDQCQHAEIRSTGDISIRKEGSIQSQLYAEGNVAFLDQSAICRGGVIVAGERVICAGLGSGMGGMTTVKAGTEITAQKVNQGRLCIGKYSREIWEPTGKIKAYVKNNQLMVVGTSQR